MNRHYVYIHKTLNSNTPFYIGIGTKQYGDCENLRKRYARSYSKSLKSNFWHRVVRKYGYYVEILLESDNYEFINQKEIEFIKLYGRRDKKEGTLVNLTDGGGGIIDFKFSDSTRQKMSKSAKLRILEGRGLTKEQYKQNGSKISKILKGVKKGTTLTSEQKKNLYSKRLEKLSKRVIQEDSDGNFIKEWYSTVDVSKFCKVLPKTVWKACKQGWRLKGFKWKFKE